MRWAIAILLFSVLPLPADNFMLRWTPLQWTNFVRGVAGTNSGSTNSPAGLQWGSVNLTNWSTLGTNTLTNYVRWVNLQAQTNTVWERITNGTQTVAATWTAVDTEETNVLMVFSPASDTLVRFDMVNSWSQTNYVGADQVIDQWLLWTDTSGQPVKQNLYGQIDDYLAYMPNSPGSGLDYTTVSNRVLFSRRSLLATVKGGTSMVLSNFLRNSINGPDEPFGTNVFTWSLSREREITTVKLIP